VSHLASVRPGANNSSTVPCLGASPCSKDQRSIASSSLRLEFYAIGPHVRAHDGLGAGEIVRGRRTYRTVAASICIDELPIRLLLLCSKHYETELCSPRDGFSPAVRIELGENGGDVKLGGVEGDSQPTCDCFVGSAVRHRNKHFKLAGR
jgi:hypothetical protein